MAGALETSEGGQPRIRFERHLPRRSFGRRSPNRPSWSYWFPTSIDGEREAGALLAFKFPNNEAPPFEGEMLVFDPPHVLELRWGGDRLRIELQPVEGGTLLIFFDTLEELGKAARDGAGWHTCLDALSAHLDGAPTLAVQRRGGARCTQTTSPRSGPPRPRLGHPRGWRSDHALANLHGGWRESSRNLRGP
jgi:hypothetical protein